MTTIFSPELRVLECGQCGAPVQGTIHGGQVRCHYCSAVSMLTARDDSRDRAAATRAPTMPEAQRYERLRAQDGQPLMPPPALMSLLAGGGLTAQNEGVAHQQWKQALQEVAAGGSFGAASRVYFLSLMLYGLWSPQKQDAKIRALLESGLDHLTEPRHRQVLHAMLARNAARVGDLGAADHWLSLCDPVSDDLHMDTAYRMSLAFIATMRHDFARVLATLGSQIDDVPIADSSDLACGIFRANALEKSGRHQEAAGQLAHWIGRVGEATVSKVIAANAELTLCTYSLQQARQQEHQMEADVVETKTGFNFWWLQLPLMLGIFGLGGLITFAQRHLDASVIEVIIPVAIGVFLLGTFVFVGMVLSKGARARKRLQKTGVRAQATLIQASTTGTRVNHQPQLLLKLKVQIPGQPPYVAMHRQIVNQLQMAQFVPGVVMAVLVDPNDRATMVLETGG